MRKGLHKAPTAKVMLSRIHDALAGMHSTRNWLLLREFPLEAGARKGGAPRIDALALKFTNDGGFGKPLAREAYEIKLTRRDFFNELKAPAKRERAYKVADRYWFVTPSELVDASEIPTECGLITVPRHGLPCLEKFAADLEPQPPSLEFMMDAVRRAYQIGRSDASKDSAFDNFHHLMQLAEMLIENRATKAERTKAILLVASGLKRMQRHNEAQEIERIAKGLSPAFDMFHSTR